MKGEGTVKQLVSTIDKAIAQFNGRVPAMQQRMVNDLELMLKELRVDTGGKVKPTVENLKLVGSIKAKLDELFRSGEYIKLVTDYAKQFNEITALQNQYFTEAFTKFKPTPLLAEIRKQSLAGAIQSLTGAGISANVSNVVAGILQKNVTTGGSYTELMKTVREQLLTTPSGAGLLERYTKQITTDALNQYSAQYTNAVTNDLGLEWYMYTGALIASSRTFCEALIKKKYFHRSEIPAIVKGDFQEFRQMDGAINSKTKLPEGMIADTTAANFHVYRGGWNCGHQMIPIDVSSVPAYLVAKFR